MQYENDNHQQTEYQRPSTKYRCGRGAQWGAPCWQGPDANKKCGGTSECTPTRQGDRYYCQRPKSAGGACADGPLPDGSCCHTHLPCQPRDTIRGLRGKLALFGALAILILIAVLSNRDDGAANNFMINPGALSSAHAGFPITDQCENCHQPHQQSTTGWLMSAFQSKDMTKQCTQCHIFEGKATAPHNQHFEAEEKNTEIQCISCHHEHKGADFSISKIPNQTCSSCHEKSFTSFSEHTAFAKNFPHQQPQNIFFDHAKHLSEYFVEDKWVNKPGRDAKMAKEAKSKCVFCHQLETAQRDIPVRDYSITCAGCHDQQIKQRPMSILTADDMSLALLKMMVSSDDEELETDEVAPQLVSELAKKGISAISNRLNKTGIDEAQQYPLFKGLSSNLLKRTARKWVDEEEIELNDKIRFGWQAAENDDGAEALLYRPDGHDDDVIRSWIEWYMSKAGDDESAEEALLELLDIDEGPGACGKCHGAMAGLNTGKKKFTAWGRTALQERVYSPNFSHRPHLDLLGKNRGCNACHKLSDDAEYTEYFKQNGNDAALFQSGFNGVEMQVCTECHNSKRISDDCQLCHVYHKGAGFKFEYQKRELKVINHE